MYLLAPANPGELTKKSLWFKKTGARGLAAKFNIDFGFEIKPPLDELKEAPPLFWGAHLPDYLATNWYYHPEKREEILHEATLIARLNPDYVVMHLGHFLWEPPRKEYVARYFNRTSPGEYFKLYQANLELVKRLKNYFPLKVENYPLYGYYMEGDDYLPSTYLMTGIGRLNDWFKFTKEAGVGRVFDVEHMILTLNFLQREKNYADLTIEEPEIETLADKKIKDLFGFSLKKGYVPYISKKLTLKNLIKKAGTKYFHLTGSVQDVDHDKKHLTHGPIDKKDKTFRKNLRLILAEKPEVIVAEIANSLSGKFWHDLRPNEDEISFENLCEILLEEL